MYSTLVRRIPAFADILLPGSNINLSFLFLNFSSRHEIRSKGDGGTSFSYEIPRPPPRSKNSSEISKFANSSANSKILSADFINPSRSKICDPM